MMSFDHHEEPAAASNKHGESSLKRNTGLRTPHLSVAGLLENDAQSLAYDITQSKLTSLAITGVASNHAEVMKIVYQDGVKQSKSIQSLSVVSSLGNIEAFVDVLPSLRCLKMWSSAIDSDDADTLRAGMANNSSIKELSICFDSQSFKTVQPLLLGLAERAEPLEKLLLRGTSYPEINLAETENRDSILQWLNVVIAAGKAPLDIEIVSCDAPEKDWVQLGESLAKSTSLISLSIVNSTLKSASVRGLSEGLTHTTSLQKLRLCRNKLGNDGVRDLALGLVHNTSITTLQLVNNEIGDDSIPSLSNLLNGNHRIEELNLMRNTIGPVGAQQLVNLASGHSSLQSLSLAENVAIGVNGLKMIGEGLSTLQLKKLEISLRPFWEMTSSLSRRGEPNAKELQEAAGRALVDGIESNYHIHDLSVSWIDVPPKFKNVIRFYCDLNKCGRKLLATEQNEVPPAAWCQVLAKCNSSSGSNSSPSLLYYFLQQKPELMMASQSRSST